jgi:hypothetical protein
MFVPVRYLVVSPRLSAGVAVALFVVLSAGVYLRRDTWSAVGEGPRLAAVSRPELSANPEPKGEAALPGPVENPAADPQQAPLAGALVEAPIFANLLNERRLRLSVDFAGGGLSGEPRFEHWVSLRMGSSPLFANKTSVFGGLRVEGLDIERIKSDRPLVLLSATAEDAPPVIWMARKGPAE